MQIEAAYPVIVTDRVSECRDFYRDNLGFGVLFEASWFAYLTAPGESAAGIAFMASDHPSQPPGPERFGGEGAFITLQVVDAAAEFARLSGSDVPVEYSLRDEPWGQRRFGLRDPAGLLIDIVEQIEPAPGYWDRYSV